MILVGKNDWGGRDMGGAKVIETPPKVGYPVDLIWVTVGSL